jgi:hypothetical protein
MGEHWFDSLAKSLAPGPNAVPFSLELALTPWLGMARSTQLARLGAGVKVPAEPTTDAQLEGPFTVRQQAETVVMHVLRGIHSTGKASYWKK